MKIIGKHRRRRNTGRIKFGKNSGNGCLGLLVVLMVAAGIVLAIAAVIITLVLWLIMFFLPPMLLLNLGLWALVASFFLKKYKQQLLALSVVGGVYMLLDMNMAWTAGLFYQGVSANTTFFDYVVYINSVSLAISIYLLASKHFADQKDDIKIKLGIPAAGFLLAFTIVVSYQYIVRDNMLLAFKDLKPFGSEVEDTKTTETPLAEVKPIETLNDLVDKDFSEGRFYIDTVIEPNLIEHLDPSIHQLFIDTSKGQSEYYQRILNWQPPNDKVFASQANYVLQHKRARVHPFKIEDFVEGYPREYVRLRSFKGEHYLYDRSNGSDTRYVLTDSTFIIYGPLESTLGILGYLDITENQKFAFVMNTAQTVEDDKRDRILIRKVSDDGSLFEISHSRGDEQIERVLATPIDKAHKFPMIVNYSPEMMMPELMWERLDKKN